MISDIINTKGVLAYDKESFLRFIYQAASIQRWNDHIRPHWGFTELDKQSHKMFYAYVISRLGGCRTEHRLDTTY